nr:retrovirus-related Pol polyprotein from transposon TNT 1-94 [Tanacetum cinerariifolium]
MIKRVYYVEGLNHNLFSVGQFCDADLEVAFRKSTCYILDLKENDLLTEQADWRDDTDDDELEDQELEAYYMYMAQLQEVSPDAANSGPIFDDEPLQKLIEIVLFIVDSGCSKQMMRNIKLLINFVEKFLGTVKFRNDQIAPILGYGDLQRCTKILHQATSSKSWLWHRRLSHLNFDTINLLSKNDNCGWSSKAKIRQRSSLFFFEDGNPARANVKQALGRGPYALSWKPCQGDSLNLHDHRTRNHAEFMSSMNANQHHTGQGESSSRSRPSRPSVSFPSCIHCGYNDHHSNDCLYYPTYEICGSYEHNTHGHNRIISLRRGINPRNPQHVTKNYETCGSNVHTTLDHNDIEWFRIRETLQAKNAESFKANKNDSSNALRSKTPTKRIISLRRGINPRNPQHVIKNYETCGSNVHTTLDHNDIEWFRIRETLQAKNAESFKANKNDSSNALRSKTPTKSEAKANPQLSSGMSSFNLNKPIYSIYFIIHSESASGNDASAASIAEADVENSDQTKSVSKGLETVLTKPIIGKRASSVASQIEEETSSTIKLEDLANDEGKDDEVHATKNVKTEDTSVLKSLSPKSSQVPELTNQLNFPNVEQLKEILVKSLKTKFSNILSAHDFNNSLPTELKNLPSKFNDLTKEVKWLKNQVYNLEIKLPGELKEIPPKLDGFTKTFTSLTSPVAELKSLQWELPAEFLAVPSQVDMIQAKLKTLDALPSLINKVTNALNQFTQAITSKKTRGDSVPSAGQVGT